MNDALTELIRSLTKNEKRYIDRLASLYSGKKEQDYFLLYRLIEGNSKLSPKALKKKIEDTKLDHIQSKKKYLYNFILDALHKMGTGSKDEQELLTNYSRINVLIAKDLARDALKISSKTIKKARESESAFLIMLLVQQSTLIELTKKGIDRYDATIKISQELEKTCNAFARISQQYVAFMDLFNKKILNLDAYQDLFNFYEQEIAKGESNDLFNRELYSYYQIKIFDLYYNNHTDENLEKIAEYSYQVLEFLLIKGKKQFNNFVKLLYLNNLIYLSFYNNAIVELTSDFKEMLDNGFNAKSKFFHTSYEIILFNYNILKTFTQAEHIYDDSIPPQFFAQLNNYVKHSSGDFLPSLAESLVCYCILHKEYQLAKDILDTPQLEEGTKELDTHQNIWLYQLIISYELDITRLLKSNIHACRYFIKKHKIENQNINLIVNLFDKMSRKDENGILKELEKIIPILEKLSKFDYWRKSGFVVARWAEKKLQNANLKLDLEPSKEEQNQAKYVESSNRR